MKELYIGIMSGTSLDGVDVAIARFDAPNIEFVSLHSEGFLPSIRRHLFELATLRRVEMDALARMHFQLAEHYARAVQAALKAARISSEDIRAIGLHGQTVRHLPHPPHPATLQLGSGTALAVLTEIDVVSDFRSADLALGGQGAPLMPMFDYAFFRSDSVDRLLVNIGGIANVTWLPRDAREEEVIAFDTGPGNMLLDSVARQYFHQEFDVGGSQARHGKCNEELVRELLSKPYFDQPPPKSTGRELFSEQSLNSLHRLIAGKKMDPRDALATLTEVTARSIAQSLRWVTTNPGHIEVIVSGGGAFNTFLLERIAQNLPESCRVVTSEHYGIPSQAKEAVAFAFFAKAFVENIPIHLPATTGARRRAVLGSLSLGGSV